MSGPDCSKPIHAGQRAFAGIVVGALSVPCALAQSGGESTFLEEIVVTATKRPQSLQDVPVSVSAISSEDILARGFTQYGDYLNSVPSVSFQDTGPGVSGIRIRGLTGESTVATYFGETVTSVVTNQGGKPNLRLVDIERVEVLRGPQGTLFGADALAGVVRIVPSAPDLQEFSVNLGTRGFTTAHSDDVSYHVEGTLNAPLIADRLAVRLVGYQDDIAGYVDNVVPAREALDYSFLADVLLGLQPGTTPAGTLVAPGNPAIARADINTEETRGGRAALAWQATDRLRFDLTLATQDVTLDSEPQIEPAVGEYAQQRELDFFDRAQYAEEIDLATLVVNYDWDAVSLVSATSFTKMTRLDEQDINYFAEGSFGIPLPWALRNDSEGELFTQEVRLQSQGEGAIEWIVGAFYMDHQSDISQRIADYSCPTCLPALLFGQDFGLRVVPGENLKYFSLEQRSIFGEVSYELAPRWTLGVGARYVKQEIGRTAPAIEGFLVGGRVDGEEPVTGSAEEVNPSAYLRFKATDGVTLYLQAARGFRSGQANQVLSYTGACAEEAAAIGLGPITDPDTLWSYELGMKSRFADGRVGVNADVYQHQWEGVQLSTSLQCRLNGSINGGDVTGHGAELEMTAQLTDALGVNLAAAYNRNEFDAVRPETGYVKGERLSGTPEKNLSAGLQYDFDLNARWSAFARADYVYVGPARYKFGQGSDARIVVQDSHDLANVRFGVQRDSLAVDLFGRNITDERAVVSTADPLEGGYQYLLRPREIGIELRYSFR